MQIVAVINGGLQWAASPGGWHRSCSRVCVSSASRQTLVSSLLNVHPLQTSLLLVFVCLLSCRSSFYSTPAPCALIYTRWAHATRAIPFRAGLSPCLALWGVFQPPRKKSSWQPVAAEMSLFKKQTVKLRFFFFFLATTPGAQALRSAAGSPRPRVSHGN